MPIILKPVHWQDAPFSNLQAPPNNSNMGCMSIAKKIIKFCCRRGQVLDPKDSHVIRSVLVEIVKTVSSAYGKTSNYGKLLESYTDQLQNDIDLKNIRKLVSGLAAETRIMIKSRGLTVE